MNERTIWLRTVMRDRKLTDQDVARILGRSPATVRIWRCTTDDSRVIPHRLARDLLHYTLTNETKTNPA